MIDPRWIPMGYQQIAAFSTVQSLTVPTVTLNGATIYPTMALIRCETNNVRWRDDGTAPTASVGQLILPADEYIMYVGPLGALQFIPVTGSATLDVTYYR